MLLVGICSFTGMTEPLIKSVRLLPASDLARAGHPWDLPAIAQLADGLELDPKVTYLIGENGSGKSSLLSAIAMAAGMNPEGGSSNYAFPTEGIEAEPYESNAAMTRYEPTAAGRCTNSPTARGSSP
jgi:predicted ATPase